MDIQERTCKEIKSFLKLCLSSETMPNICSLVSVYVLNLLFNDTN